MNFRNVCFPYSCYQLLDDDDTDSLYPGWGLCDAVGRDEERELNRGRADEDGTCPAWLKILVSQNVLEYFGCCCQFQVAK